MDSRSLDAGLGQATGCNSAMALAGSIGPARHAVCSPAGGVSTEGGG